MTKQERHALRSARNSMISRCYKKNNNRYYRYGARGITVCQRWLDSLDNFISDMGVKPSPSYSLERKDNNGPYCPSSCVWVTPTRQARNRVSNRLVEFRGEKKCLADWSELLGLPRGVIEQRLRKLKWSVEKAFTTPLMTTAQIAAASALKRWGHVRAKPNAASDH